MSGQGNNSRPIREAIALAIFIGAIAAMITSWFHQPLAIPVGIILFIVAFVVRVLPQLRDSGDDD